MRYIFALLVLFTLPLHAGEPDYTRQSDVIYGRKFGMALTMDVFRPKANANGAGIIIAVSGGWISSHEAIDTPFFTAGIGPQTARGYTVFAVVHGSQPRFTISDAVADMNRAVRFIRFHAKEYGVDPNRLGITGGSAGGHLSLLQGVKPEPANSKSPDPVDRESSNVEAVACFFPPTDFLNYGKKGELAWDFFGAMGWYTLAPAFDFQRQDTETHEFVQLFGTEKKAAAKNVSPIYFVSAKTPPTLIIHGDADHLVPIDQSKRFIEALKNVDVPCQLIVKPGKDHGWAGMQDDEKDVCDWFDKYLAKPATQPTK